MLRRKSFVLGVFGLLVLAACAARQPGQPISPGFNMFSREQDIQIGREAAQQVRQELPVIEHRELQEYVNRIGRRLAATPQAGDFPYEFGLIHQGDINAFALPGGPIFINTGLIRAAENEAQLAGVLAHEIAHVALRHGTNQVSKATLLQIPAALAGVALGEGTLGQVLQLGLGVGLNGLFLRYSRSAETEADALGARMLAEAGYNPLEMARFFEMLDARGGPGAPEFLSSHPRPGNRMRAVQDEIAVLPERQYVTAQEGGIERPQQMVAQLPAPPAAPRASAAVANGPAGLTELQTDRFTIAHPPDWQAFRHADTAAITLAPRRGLVRTPEGVAIGNGAVIGYHQAPPGVDPQRGTDNFIRELRRTNPTMRVVTRSQRVMMNGTPGMLTRLSSESPLDDMREVNLLLTIPRPEGLFYVVFVAPEPVFAQHQGTFQQMMTSLRFPR